MRRAVESRGTSFLWFGTNNSKGAKVKWTKICSPKKEGGLGLKKIEDWNKAYIARLIWLLFAGSKSLWIAWVHAHLLKDQSFWTSKLHSGISWTRRKILNFRETGRKLVKFR